MAVTASFANDLLTIIADALDNNVEASRNAAGQILVNGGAVNVVGGTPTVANTALIQAFGQGGDDTIALNEANGALPAANLFGGAGNDVLTGGSGADQLFGQGDNDTLLGKGGADFLFGGDGNDTLTGGDADDQMFGEAGNDRMIWNPGDDSDLMEGGIDIDTAEVNGGNGAETFSVSANGARVKFDRDTPAPFTLDIGTTENLVVNMNGGADILNLRDLTGTTITTVSIGMGGTDAQADYIQALGTTGADTIDIVGAGTSVAVTGLHAAINVTGAEGANDTLEIQGLGGNDTMNAAGLVAGVIKLTLDGGNGNDTIIGSQGADLILGGGGSDTITGGRGNDVASMGEDDDTFVWNPGDGNDTVEGQGGTDTLLFNCANVNEKIDISANGARVLFARDVAAVTMDLNDVENVTFKALGGADTITVGDLSGTDAKKITVDLAAPGGAAGDGAADAVTVNGTQGDDTITVVSDAAGTMTVTGLAATVVIEHGEAANDRLTINGQGGADTINASGVAAGQMQLTINGGLGNDIMIGGAGDDLFTGGDGDDTALMGAGNDTFVWNPGDDNDVVEGQDGTDTLLFNGANIAEKINISANGNRVLFTRDIANVVMDTNDVETIHFNALGGADLITVNDLSATDVKTVEIDLGATGNGDDTAADTVVINGTSGNDTIALSIVDGKLVVDGLAYKVVIDDFHAGDKIQINGLAGDDVIDASALGALAAQLVFDGGQGNDILIGGGGNDTLLGNDGDDVLIGNAGQDVLDGGNGSNTVFQDLAATVTQGVLTLFGTNAGENITVSRNAAGEIFANGAALPGAPTVAGIELIQVFGKDGNDVLTLVETNGALPRAEMFGGAGNDTITGGSGADQLFGEAGNDTLLGKGGNDVLFGGDGDDVLTGGDGDDMMFGEAGNDRMIWNPGDDTDLVEGGDGTDTAEVNGADGDEVFTATANGTRVRFDRVTPGPFSLDIGTTENLVVNMNGGNDMFSATGNLAALIKITVDGGAGDDTILGGNGADLLIGGTGNDFIDGQQGNDTILMGEGDDTFQWDPGDGSDTVEGGAGFDTMLFNGSNASENIDIAANGERVRFTRDVAAITMDLNDVERIRFNALGGADNIVVNDLSGTDAREVEINLAVNGAGDGAADKVTVQGSNGNDGQIKVATVGGAIVVSGLAAQTTITGSEAANDQLVVNGLAGNDVIDASGLATGMIKLTLNGGAGNDALTGSAGTDLLNGDAGDDRIIRNAGPAGADVVEGGDGTDTFELNGATSGETIAVTANGARVAVETGGEVSDLGGVENVVVNANGGNDTISAVGNLAALIKLTVDGGAGDDTILGSNGADTLLGGAGNDFIDGQQGNDTILMGDGDDTFQWDPGDGSDTVDGGAGFDTMLFNGANIGEIFDLSANGDHARFTRNIASIVMDLDNLEKVKLNALSGADAVTVGDLSGTDVKQVDIDLGSNTQAPDGAVDAISVSGSNAGNQIKLTDAINAVTGGTMKITGLPGEVNIAHADTTDTLIVQALGGDDTIDASAVTGAMKLTLDAGAGNDVIIAGLQAHVMNGGEGNDTVSFAGSVAGVTVNLATNEVHGGNAEGDTITGFENVTGTAQFDILTGSDQANVIDGGAGTDLLKGNGGADTLTGGTGNDQIDGGAGDDTAVFNVDFDTVKVTFEGKSIVIESADGRDVVTGIEHLKFTDGPIDLKDENPLVNDLFYYANNKDVWDSGADADVHYATFGFREGRDPNAEFSTKGYLSANADVRAAGINPLEHFATIGFKEGRDPSARFDIEQYLAANPDVAISGKDPLTHFEAFGRDEGRAIFDAVGRPSHNGFDAEFYLLNNPDVGFAGADPLQHYQVFGHNEGRDPNAFFDAKGYLAAYSDVAAAGVDPFQHYLTFGAAEGRDPSGAFDTRAYLAANPDVAAAGVNPLLHFLEFGVHEGRSPHGDGLFA